MTRLDTVVVGGLVVDGTGAPARQADVGIVEGRIRRVGRIARNDADRVVEADGAIVAPGFIDVHTHYDAQLLWDPTASPSTLHGVTTVIAGNCGFSLAPLRPEDRGYLQSLMARVEGMPVEALEASGPWEWATVAEYLARLRGTLAVNAGFLVGHSALRRRVMGEAASERSCDGEERQEMCWELAAGLTAGALGFSTSLSPTHNEPSGRPVPSRFAERSELLALALVLREYAGTSLQLIPQNSTRGFTDEDVELMTDMSLAGERPLNWNVLPIDPADPSLHERQLEASTYAAARGARVVALTLPHSNRIRFDFHTGLILDSLPGWSHLFELGIRDRMAALSHPATREMMRQGAASEAAGMVRRRLDWPRVEVAETFSRSNEGMEGRLIGQIANELHLDPFDALLDIVIADELRTGLLLADIEENAQERLWATRAKCWNDTRALIGGSDAGAHLDSQCGAILTTAFLAEAVRNRRLLELEEAVKRLTAAPAELYGIKDRGLIREGAFADVVVFDPDTVGPSATTCRSDLPGGASRLYAEATGLDMVMVNGEIIVDKGRATNERPGRLLEGGVDTVAQEAWS